MTYTYVELDVSAPAFDEIRIKLERAGYDHALIDNTTIDMRGIALKRVEEPEPWGPAS